MPINTLINLKKRFTKLQKEVMAAFSKINGYSQDYIKFVENYYAVKHNTDLPHTFPILEDSFQFSSLGKEEKYKSLLYNYLRRVNHLILDTNSLIYDTDEDREVLKNLLSEAYSLHNIILDLEKQVVDVLVNSPINQKLLK